MAVSRRSEFPFSLVLFAAIVLAVLGKFGVTLGGCNPERAKLERNKAEIRELTGDYPGR